MSKKRYLKSIFMGRKYLFITFPLLLLVAFASLPPLILIAGEENLTVEDDDKITILSAGTGPGTITTDETTAEDRGNSALMDAERKAVIYFIFDTIGDKEFSRIERGIDSLILDSYEKYVIKSEIIYTTPLPLTDDIIITAEVTLNSSSLSDYLENVSRLEPKPLDPEVLTSDEIKGLTDGARKLFIQGEVASEMLYDHVRGIELFTRAIEQYREVGDDEGLFLSLIGRGRASGSLGQVKYAMADFLEALGLSREMGMDRYRARADLEMARLLILMGDYDGALEYIPTSRGSNSRPDPDIPDGLKGEILMALTDIDYALDRPDKAIEEIREAISIFETLGDVRRLGKAQLTLGLILLSVGDVKSAIMELKFMKKLSEKFKDNNARVITLIALGRAYMEIGDNDGAEIFLKEALVTAKESGWIVGEVRANIGLSRLSRLKGETDRAISFIFDANELVEVTGSPSPPSPPSLIAAALYTQGLIFLDEGNKKDALKSLSDAVETASKPSVIGSRYPFDPFTEGDLKDALTHLLGLTMELEKEEKGLFALLTYQGVLTAMEFLSSSIYQDYDEGLIDEWREAMRTSLCLENLILSTDTSGVSESSLSVMIKKREEVNKTIREISNTILRKDPKLAILLKIDVQNPRDLKGSVGENSAFVRYFLGEERAFALLMTYEELTIIELSANTGEIEEFVAELNSYIQGEDSDPDEGPPPSPSTSSFEEASNALYNALITPLLFRLTDTLTLGISPGVALTSVPFFALGGYQGDGEFRFLFDEYDLFIEALF